MPELCGLDFVGRESDAAEIITLNLLLGFAMRTDRADKTLGHDGFNRGGNEEWFDAHVNEAGECARSVVGVERAEDKVAGKGSADGNFGGFEVADFADHD